jgi:hypothetical protein
VIVGCISDGVQAANPLPSKIYQTSHARSQKPDYNSRYLLLFTVVIIIIIIIIIIWKLLVVEYLLGISETLLHSMSAPQAKFVPRLDALQLQLLAC